jgi:hypothetical protein
LLVCQILLIWLIGLILFGQFGWAGLADFDDKSAGECAVNPINWRMIQLVGVMIN